MTEIIFNSDEVINEKISMALITGPVVIKATDAQAQKILKFHKKDAFNNKKD